MTIAIIAVNAAELEKKLNHYFTNSETVPHNERIQGELTAEHEYPCLVYMDSNDWGPTLMYDTFAELLAEPDFQLALSLAKV